MVQPLLKGLSTAVVERTAIYRDLTTAGVTVAEGNPGRFVIAARFTHYIRHEAFESF